MLKINYKKPNKAKLTNFLLMFLLLVFSMILLIKLFELFDVYSDCKDDFRVISECECLPYEGNYSYYADKLDVEHYDSMRRMYWNGSYPEN
ncbi:MAG: hypothetical protein ACOCRX_04165 [Candidatus Woesearchaeota archaeon]